MLGVCDILSEYSNISSKLHVDLLIESSAELTDKLTTIEVTIRVYVKNKQVRLTLHFDFHLYILTAQYINL